ncbi:general substrate transporter [Dactylonectria estremocensis]|uniref:General substrate transporter n=1 Tax=Dactylonectria estremocensis TaxID=1079267 RepID=A0A9P9E0J9_9HYPO|nr:general substrate transporter [Dactylonectria estremocensis]
MIAGSSVYNFLAVLTSGLGSFMYGFNSAVIGSIFGLPAFFEYFDLTLTGKESAPIIGATNGLFAGGGLLGCILVPSLSDRIGRVRAIQIICVLGVVSAALQASSVHIAMFLAGRFMNGLAAGMINATVPVYQSEISPAQTRGRLVSTHGIFLVLGYSGSAWSGFGLYFAKHPQLQWRLCLALQAVAPGVLGLASPWIPESPRWLVMTGSSDKALRTLERLHQKPGETDHELARSEFAQITLQLDMHPRNENIFSLLKTSTNRKRFFAGIFVQFITQCTGILVVNNYQIMLWESIGQTGSRPLLLYAVYLTWASVLNVVSSMIVDRVGRVRLLCIGVAGLVCMLSVFVGLFSNFAGSDNEVGKVMCIVTLFLWLTFYATCIDAVCFVYVSEIFPTQMRSKGVAASVGALFAVTLILTQSAATAFADIGWKFYLVFIIVPACGLPILWRLPETKGLSLEEIAAVFGDDDYYVDSAVITSKDVEGQHGEVRKLTSTKKLRDADLKTACRASRAEV